MNALGKIFGLIILVLIILIIVNFRTILPYFNNLALGGTSSPFDISSQYISQIENMYPKVNTQPITYSSSKFSGQYYSNSNINQKNARVSVEKIGTILVVTTQNLPISQTLQGKVHLWLANTAVISNATTYVDLGLVRDGGIQTYKKDVGPQPLSLAEYKYIMIVDPTNFTIYTEAVLNK